MGDAAGMVEGSGALPVAPERVDMGVWDDGLRLDRDLGRKRVGWNQAAVMARLPFSRPRDLSAAAGITVTLRPQETRNDATVTLWREEADGGWYYHTGSIPLNQREIRYTALFEDFTEAEWISPTNHMDDDCS